MNEKLFRPQFDTLKLADKLWLMQTLATRYHLTFKELYAFSRWGQSCTTGLFEKGGREFVFVPGDTVILGWESFVQASPPTPTGWRTCRSGRARTARVLRYMKLSALNAMVIAGERGCAIP